jgi:hypothetical protein
MPVASGYSETRVDAEVAQWPGAAILRREKTKRHQRLVLGYNGSERFVIYPLTPSDWRGELNHLQDVRKTLRDMGAKRLAPRKAKVHRNRNRQDRNPLARVEMAPVKANPFEALQAIEFQVPRNPEGLWKRMWRKLKGLVHG